MSEQQQPDAPENDSKNEAETPKPTETGGNGAPEAEVTKAAGAPEAPAAEEASPEAAAPESEAAAPESEAAAPESEAAAPESEAAAPESESASPESKAAAPESETPAPDAKPAAPPQGGVQVRRRHKPIYAAEVKAGQTVDGVFLVLRKNMPVDRTGKRFLAVTLADRTGRLESRLWDGADEASESFRQSDHVRIRGQAQLYQGRLQLRLESIEPVDVAALDLPSSEFVAESKKPIEQMFTDLVALVDGMQNAHLKALLHAFLDDPDHARRFKRAPAAQSIHHAWIGGLLEHTLSVMQLCVRLCDHYPQVDRDLVLAGAFFHDYGKIDELAYEDTLGYTDEGRLVGHLVMCCQWLRERAQEIEAFPKSLLDQLVHIVVSHHGHLEYGSPRTPQTLEALVVHNADLLDARVSSWTELLEGAGPDGWTDFVRVYDRQLFRGSSSIEGGAPTGAVRKKRKKRRKKKPVGGTPREAGASTEGSAAGANARPGAGPRRGRPAGASSEGGRRPRPERRDRPRSDRPARGGAKDRPKPQEKPTLTFNPFAALGQKAEGGGEEAKAPAEPEKTATEPEQRPTEPDKTQAGPEKAQAEPAKTPTEPEKTPAEPEKAPAERNDSEGGES